MDINQYDESIRILYQAHLKCVSTNDKEDVRILRRLEKKALALNDPTLLGFVYHSLAYAEYFSLGRYDAFHRYLRKASVALFQSGDHEELSHVYYLVAIDAINKGMYDIACTYFLMARDLTLKVGLVTSAAILDASVGRVLLLLGSAKKARVYLRDSARVIRKNKHHPNYYGNVVCGYIDEGTALLAEGDVSRAQRAYDKAASILQQNRDRLSVGRRFDVALFGVCLAIAKQEDENRTERLKEMLSLMEELSQIVDYIEDLSRLCNKLIGIRAFDAVRRILQVADKKPIPPDAVHADRMLIDLKVCYYAASGQEKALMKAYQRQDKVYHQLLQEQNNTYRYAQELIHLINELQKEQERVQKEHETLLQRASTDALTRIPNRHALNSRMEQAFEHAYRNQIRLGVCILDVDGLKDYNDTFGHPAGDRVLAKIGTELRKAAKDERIFAARYGGDEFVLICDGLTDQKIREIAAKLTERIPLHFSMGVCNAVPLQKNRSWDFLANADQALYLIKRAKKKDRNQGDIRFRNPVPFEESRQNV